MSDYFSNQISSLPSPNKAGKAVVVPNKGLYIFGGFSRPGSYTDRLTTIDGTWETSSPSLFQGASVVGHCVLQVRTILIRVKVKVFRLNF